MEIDFQEISRPVSATWDVFVPAGPDLSSSEASEDDVEEIFDDTYSDFIENSDKETEKFDYNKNTAELKNFSSKVDQRIDSEMHQSLISRVEVLKETIRQLGELLSEEHRLWKQEREEYDLIREKINSSALAQVTAVARAATEAYAVESTKATFPEPSLLGRTPLATLKPSNPFVAHWNMLNNDYYKKLNHVERLCTEELQKIYSDAELLKPLKQIISQWDILDENSEKTFEIQEVRVENNIEEFKYEKPSEKVY